MNKSPKWFQKFFRDFRPFFNDIPAKRTADEVRYIIKKLGLKKGSTFLDCPCGIGRISLPLAERGIRVTGVDITREYLDEVAEVAKRRKLKIELQQGDMRRIKFANRFDAAGNLWTSFGYFQNDGEEMKTLRAAYRALKPGGKFLLHVINRDYILAHYTDSSVSEYGGVLSFERRKFDFATSVNHGIWQFLRNGEMTTHDVGIRMYSFHELLAMFHKAGFVDVVGYGGTKDEPISQHQTMMWVFGTKPKR